MVTTAPKNSRNKRLHIVFFTDASKTKSTSISVRNLIILGCGAALFFIAASSALYLYKQNRNTLAAKDEYIRELKSAITSYAVSNEKNQLAMANDTEPQTELARRIAREIQFPSAPDPKSTASSGDNTLANLQSSLSSLSTVSANLARNDKPAAKATPINFAKSSADSKPATASAESADKKQANSPAQPTYATSETNAVAKPAVVAAKPATLVGIQVEPGHATEANGKTTLHFQLVNTLKNRGQSWTGRVCGIAELAQRTTAEASRGVQVGLSAKGQTSGFVALPGGFKVDSARQPTNGCADGQLVRFSRLRPTELVIPAKQDSIKRVTIFFVETGSNRMLTQPVEL